MKDMRWTRMEILLRKMLIIQGWGNQLLIFMEIRIVGWIRMKLWKGLLMMGRLRNKKVVSQAS